jgi:hypothetical protein
MCCTKTKNIMSARSLRLSLAAVNVTAARGSVRGMFGNHGGTVGVSLVTVPTVLDRFMTNVKSNEHDPFHRSPDVEPSFEQRDVEDR